MRAAARSVRLIGSAPSALQFAGDALGRVAVIGGGVGGCAAAASLARSGARVSLFEVGRAQGGRTASRWCGDNYPGVTLQHGAPSFDCRTPVGRDIAARLALRHFDGVVGTLDAADGSFAESSLASVLHFDTVGLCAALLDEGGARISTAYDTLVHDLEPLLDDCDGGVGGWRLKDRESNVLCDAEWIVVAGSGIAHPRWSQLHGEKGGAPLRRAADIVRDDALDGALDVVGALGAQPVRVVLFLCEGTAAAPWRALPFSVAHVEGDANLAKVVVQRHTASDTVAVVAHSTAAFANRARVDDGETEAVLLDALDALARRAEWGTSDARDGAAYGPVAHRWGAAFPTGALLRRGRAVVPSARVAFCGDFVAGEARAGSVESALLSGEAAGSAVGARVAQEEADRALW